MTTPGPQAGSYCFGPFRLDTASRVLARDGTIVPLAPRTFDLLHAFVRSGGRLLTKEELLRDVWGDVNVEEASLAFQVSTLRKALGEHGAAWIVTVPKHGYRFTAPVREVRPEDTRDREALSTPPAARVRLGPAMWTGLALVAVVAAFVVFRYASRPDPPVPREIRPPPFRSPATPATRRSPRSLRMGRKWRSRGMARTRTITTSTSRRSARSSRTN